MVGSGGPRRVTEAPGRVLLNNLNHFLHDSIFFRTLVEVFHAVKEPVEFRRPVVRGIFPASLGHGFGVRPVEQREEVFRIRIVSEPSPEEDLIGSPDHLVLEPVVVGRADLKLNPELRELLLIPVEERLRA